MIYVISDLHGYDPLKLARLLCAAKITEDDSIYVLGDVIDRGKYGTELLSWVSNIAREKVFTDYLIGKRIIEIKENGETEILDKEAYWLIGRLLSIRNIAFILGNHESMMLECRKMFEEITDESISSLNSRDSQYWIRWLGNGSEPTTKGLGRLMRGGYGKEVSEMLDFLEKAPLFRTVNVNGTEFILVHAGLGNFSKDKPLDAYSQNDLVWKRPDINDEYFSDKTVVFGHTPTFYLAESMEVKGKVLRGKGWLCIDAGAAAGEGPALVCLDKMTASYGEKHDYD